MNFFEKSVQVVKRKSLFSFFAFILSISIVFGGFFGWEYLRAAPLEITCADGETEYINSGLFDSTDEVTLTVDVGGGNCTFVLVQLNTDPAIELASLDIDSSVTLTHPTTTITEGAYYKIDFDVAGQVTIDGNIDVSGKGYLGGGQLDNSTQARGRRMDNTVGSMTNSLGGSHGGKGGGSSSDFEPYDSIINPVYPGGGGSTDGTLVDPGGNGGGVVRITAGGSILGSASIFADGEASVYGGGAGGSIYLNSGNTISIGGVSADGGNSTATHGGGGGGRVSGIAESSVSFSATSTSGGTSSNAFGSSYAGSAGTIYTLSSGDTYGTLTLDNDSISNPSYGTAFPTTVASSDSVDSYGYSYTFDSVVVTDNAILVVPSEIDSTSTGAINFDRKFYTPSCPSDNDNVTDGEIVYDNDLFSAITSSGNFDYTCVEPQFVARFAQTETTASESTTSSPEIVIELAGPRSASMSNAMLIDVDPALTTASAGADFSTSTNMVFFEEGATTAIFSFSVEDDSIIESSEDIVFQLAYSFPGGDPVIEVDSPSSTTYTITDNDNAAATLNLNLGVGGVDEVLIYESGATDEYTIVLTAQPESDVEVTLSPDVDVSVSSSTVTFTTSSWNVPQTITVSAVDDLVIEGDHSGTISHTVSSSDSNFSGIDIDSVTANIGDNDSADVIITESDATTTVSESGTTDSYTVVLSVIPTESVTVNISSSSEITLSTTSIHFTPDTWDIPVEVTVTAVDDLDDEGDHGATIIHTSVSADGNFNGLPIDNVSVSITDNDTVGVTITESGATVVYEPNVTDSYTVVLNRLPSASVTVSLVTDAEITLSTSSILFTTSNWDDAITVTVSPVDDTDVEGVVTGTITHSFSSADLGYDGLSDEVIDYAKVDNDHITVTESDGSTALVEGTTSTDTISYVLGLLPDSLVMVHVTSSDDTIELSTTTLYFTPSNWNTPQVITFSLDDDDIDSVDIGSETEVYISYTVDSEDGDYDNVIMPTSTIDMTEDDIRGILGTIGGNVNESGTTTTLSIVLRSQPTANVYLYDSTIIDTTEATLSTSTFTFTPENWNIAQIAVVTGVDDDIDDGNIEFETFYPIASSTDSIYHGSRLGPVGSITNIDNDTAGITVSEISNDTSEDGNTGTFTVVLDSEPTSTVTIAVSNSDETEGTLSTSSLTFTTSNWDSEQTVTVTGVDDELDDRDIDFTIVLAAAVSDSDTNYDNLNPDDVTVTNTDDDTADISVSDISTSTTEIGGTATFTVVLTSEPTANVVISVTSSDATEATVSTSSLTFTSLNWDDAQTVTVTGVDDDADDGNIAYSIVLGAAVSADGDYNGLNADDVSVINTDDDGDVDDAEGITVSDASGDTTEAGGTATFTVVLDSLPTDEVTIALSSSDETEGTVSPETLTFTVDNWDEEQTVTVTGVDDASDDGDVGYGVVLAAAVSEDLGYDGINPDDVALTNTDNDAAQSSGGGGGGGGNGGSSPVRRNKNDSGNLIYGIIIDKGRDTTSNNAVRIDLQGTGIARVALSNFADFSGSVYLPYTPEVSWELLPGPGIKRVYVRFQTERGNMYEASDSIEVLGSIPDVEVRPDIPTGSIADCELSLNRPYKTPNSPEVYIVVEDTQFAGTNRCVKDYLPTPLYFFSYFSSWNEVESVDEATLAAIPDRENNISILGPRFIPYNGSVVKTIEDDQPYYIFNGSKYSLANDAAFHHMGFNTGWVQAINPEVLNDFREADTLTATSPWPAGLVIKFASIPSRAYQVLETTPENKVRVKDLGLSDKLDDRMYRRDRIVVLEKNINVMLPTENIGPKVTITRFLTIGSVGSDVRYLQAKLQSLGYFTYESVTGRYGYETSQAVVRFQRDHGIDPKGYVGPATRDLINSL